jgi:hypothetical protein
VELIGNRPSADSSNRHDSPQIDKVLAMSRVSPSPPPTAALSVRLSQLRSNDGQRTRRGWPACDDAAVDRTTFEALRDLKEKRIERDVAFVPIQASIVRSFA